MAYYYIPAESRVCELDANLYAQWQASNNPKADYYTPIADPPGPGYTFNGSDWVAPPVYIPQQVTRFQAKAVMLQQGLLASAQALVDNSTDPLVKLVWDEALSFDRNSPTLNAMAQALGLTSQQLDDLFIAASQVSA